MIYVDHILTKNEINDIVAKYGPYTKVTVNLDKDELVLGCELHADGEVILLEKGAIQDNIWGGGVNYILKEIDDTAVLNLRPRLGNNGLEISDPTRKEKFINVVKNIFQNLWS